jgi:predicted DNA-binding transcriptional regulator AlpA
VEATVENKERQGEDAFLTSRQVKERYGGASDQWLWRRENNDPTFPKPLRIHGRKFWKLSELAAYERSLAK